MNILIIGIGNIGLRHIQGLSKIKKINFYLLDKFKSYQIKYENELSEIKKFNKVYYLNNFQEVIKDKINYNLIVISTTAENRVYLLQKLRKTYPSTKIIIEKPICQSSSELNKLKLLKKNTYINYPIRYNPWFSKIKKEFIKHFKGNGLILNIIYPNLGLACNACHFIDFFNFLTDLNPKKILLSKEKWKKSKRKGFYDVDGVIEIYFGNNNKLIINSIASKLEEKEISIEGILPNCKFEINYDTGICSFKKTKKIYGRILFQSECSNLMYKNIKNNTNLITNLEDGIKAYDLLLKELIKSWNKKFSQNKKKIKIT